MCLGRTSRWQECVAEEVLYFMVDKKQRQSKEGARDKIPFKDPPSVTYFFQLGSTS
jgi:hypothetical protein